MKKIFLFVLMIIALVPLASKAQEYTLIEPLPCIAGTSTGGNCDVTPKINLNDYIGYIFKFSIALAAFLAVIMIIWGGFQYMTSEAPFLKLEGKNKIGGAVAGLVMILASYLILATIDPRLVEINTAIPPITFCTAANQTGCVDKGDNITKQLSDDLRALSADSQRKTLQYIEEKTKLQEELKEVEYSIENNGDLLTSEEMDALKVKEALIKEKIADKTVEINKNKASVIGQTALTRAFEEARNIGGNNKETVDANISNIIENLESQYREAKDEIIKNTSESSEAQRIADIQILEKQKEFYVSEIKKLQADAKYENTVNTSLSVSDSTIMGIVRSDKGSYNVYDVRDSNNKLISRGAFYKDGLLKEKSRYQADLNNTQAAEKSGVPIAEYKLIIERNINEIDELIAEIDTAISK